MSRSALAFAVLTLFAASARNASAQSIREYERRVHSLAKAFQQSYESRVAYETGLARDYRRFDTVTAGPLRLLTKPELHEMARYVADSAVAQLTPQYGRALDVLRTRYLVLRDERASEWNSKRDTTYALIAEIGPAGEELAPQVLVFDREVARGVAVTKILQIVLRGTHPGFASWLHNTTLPTDTIRAEEWPQARIDLLSSYSRVAHDCYDAVLGACRLALGLDPTTDPVTQWLGPVERRGIVENLEENSWWARIDHAAARVCIAGSDSTCVAILRARSWFLPDPVATGHRVGLLRMAMLLGGPGAMERALTTPGAPEHRLAVAARVPADSVVRLWVGRVRSVPKPPETMSVTMAATSVGWILVFGVLAFRSSRWR